MGRLFLPGMVVSAENQGTFSDYHGLEYNPVVIIIGGIGLMGDDVYDPDYPLIGIGSRLSKN